MAPTKNSQSILSSYFSASPLKSTKRREPPQSPIDLTGDDSVDEDYLHSDEPPIKKIRVIRPSQSQSSTVTKPKKHTETTKHIQSTFFSPLPATPQCSAPATGGSATGMAEQWIFRSQSSSTDKMPSEEIRWISNSVDEARKVKLHEAFKKKLLTHESQYRLRYGVSLAPENNFEARGKTHENLTPHADDPAAINDNGDSGSDSDPGFKEVMKVFLHSGSNSVAVAEQGKGKQTASVRLTRTKPTDPKRRTVKSSLVIGPSGEPYTPLELQVQYIMLVT